MTVLLNERFGWTSQKLGALSVHGYGDRKEIDAIAGALSKSARPGIAAAERAVHAAHGHFAAIVEGPDFLLACVDHCRSIPVFFASGEGGPVVSNDAHLLKAEAGLENPDELSALEAAMAGFVTGRYTLYEGLSQLQAGDLLWHDKRGGGTELRQYYDYRPGTMNPASETALIEQLGDVTDRAIGRVIEHANGRPIWVPLSAGLDSRLILCKLVEKGYRDLFAFTYGPAGNDEARAARAIAERLGVEWRFWPDTARQMRALYRSPTRVAYWAYGDGLCTLPNLQDFPVLHRLTERGDIPEGVVVVNGQTGDFISGGHIPKALWEQDSPTLNDLFEAIVAKHYSLWRSLKTPENLASLRARVCENLGIRGDERLTCEQAATLYERFEYLERQAKHIINGQRNYDFLGLDWALPLWDREFVDFWRDVPYEHKFRQRLYKRYLQNWDFKGLFRGFNPVVWQWPGAMKAVLPLFRVVRLLFGADARDRLQRSLLYFGMYRHMYAPFGYRYFLRHAQNLRNPISVLSQRWLAEMGIAARAV